MTNQSHAGRPRPVRSLQQERAARLSEVLGTTLVDDHGIEQHGLTWWYPQLKRWPTVRSVGSGGSGGNSGAPLNVEALDFISGKYFVGEAGDDVDDELNYREGFETTVRQLELSVRRALGQSPPPSRPRPVDELQPAPDVLAALEHLVAVVDAIARDELLYELVHGEAVRLIVRARGMMHGSRFTASRSQCMHCHATESVISDEDRAVCVNPFCRTSDGGRRCWRRDASGGWVEVPEPDLRGRGQVSDEQLSRWADAG